MISLRDVVIIGRHEAPTEQHDRTVVAGVAELSLKAYVALQRGVGVQIRRAVRGVVGEPRSQDQTEEDVFWGAWNAVACVGPLLRWRSMDFLEIAQLGRTQAPWVVQRWRYIPSADSMEWIPISNGWDAPIVFDSSKLITPSYLKRVVRLPGRTLPETAYGRLEQAETELRNLGVDLHPFAGTRHGLRERLGAMGYALVNPGELVHRPAKGQKWGLRELAPDEREVRPDDPRLPFQSTTGRAWTTLDEVLARGMGQVDPRSPQR